MAGPPTDYTLRVPVAKGRADVSPDEFAAQIDGFGLRFWWEQACFCSCRNNDQTHQPDPTCLTCGGKGYEYYGRREIRGVVMSPEIDAKSLPMIGGEFVGGQVVVTTRHEFPLGHRDRLIAMDQVLWYSEIVLRARDGPTRLRYPIAERAVTYLHVPTGKEIEISERVDRLTIHRDRRAVPLTEGEHFQITADGLLDFHPGDLRGQSPAEEKPFAIRYWARPQWVVTGLAPHPIQMGYVAFHEPAPRLYLLPGSVTATLDFLLDGA